MRNCQDIKRSFGSFGKEAQKVAINIRADIGKGRLIAPAFCLAIDIGSMWFGATSAIALTSEEPSGANAMDVVAVVATCSISAFCTYLLVGGYCVSREDPRVQFAESGDVLPVSVVAVSRANNGNILGRC
jgi:hypothetical protein